MPGEVIDGGYLAAEMCEELRPRVEALIDARRRPGFCVVLVGDDPKDHANARRKMQVCEDLDMRCETAFFPASVSEAQILREVELLNELPVMHGIMVQLPLPPHINTARVLRRVDPRKDVDGYHPLNVGMVAAGLPGGRPRAAALAIQRMILYTGMAIRGARVVVLGHTNEIARPVATLLSQEGPGGGAAVTLCPEWTQDLADVTRDADVLIAAVGRPAFVSAEMVRPGAVVIDAGANRITADDGREEMKLVGDVQFEDVRAVARAISPVPGGVGPMTIAALVFNTVEAAEACLRN